MFGEPVEKQYFAILSITLIGIYIETKMNQKIMHIWGYTWWPRN